MRLGAVPFEATTPTGAALLKTFVDEFVERPAFSVQRIGYGVGHRDGPIPNVLRVCLGEQAVSERKEEELHILECSIDDMNPKCYDCVLERLFAAGALDVWPTPVQMKKNRPGILLSVLGHPEQASRLTERLLIETMTLGVRQYPMTRTALAREIVQVMTPYGEVKVKLACHQGRALRGKPEYQDCKRLALEHDVPIHVVYAAAQNALPSESVTSW